MFWPWPVLWGSDMRSSKLYNRFQSQISFPQPLLRHKIYFNETNTLTLSYVKCPQGSGGRLRRASCCGRSQRPVGGYVHGRLQLALCWKWCFAKATLLGSKTQLAPQGSPHHTALPSHWPSWAQVLLPVKYKHVMFSWRELLEWVDRHITVAHISTLDELCSLHQLLNDFIFNNFNYKNAIIIILKVKVKKLLLKEKHS